MKYAVIKTGGKQYKVSEGDIIEIEKLDANASDDYSFDVLLYSSDQSFEIGKPKVSGVTVKGKILEQKKGEKIRVGKFKSKVRYRRVTGHRQRLSKVLIQEVSKAGEKKEEKKKEEKVIVKKVSKAEKKV